MFDRSAVAGLAFRTFLILNSSFFISTSTAQAVEVDGVAATVGTESILRSDVLNELARMGAPDGEG